TENALAEIDGIWDGVYGTNNIYVYRFQGLDLFQFIPWDKDLTFLQPNRPLTLPADNPLARRLMAIPEYRNYYLSQLAKAADLLGGADGWANQEVSRMYALFRDAALNDPHKQCIPVGSSAVAPCSAAAFEQGVRDMRAFIAERPAFIKNALAQQRYQAPAGGPVVDSVVPMSNADLTPGSIARIRGVNLGQNMVDDGSYRPRSVNRSFVAVEG